MYMSIVKESYSSKISISMIKYNMLSYKSLIMYTITIKYNCMIIVLIYVYI